MKNHTNGSVADTTSQTNGWTPSVNKIFFFNSPRMLNNYSDISFVVFTECEVGRLNKVRLAVCLIKYHARVGGEVEV
jgi:hypothetical protein